MLPLTDHELCATVRAGQRWARERDIPDPVAWADLAHAADVTAAVIQRRTAGELAPARSHSLPLPKGVGGELRGMTVPDPFDDVVFRALVGRAAQAIDESLGDEVASYRLTEAGPGWQVRDYRYATGLRMSELTEAIAAPDFRGLGTLDVRQYYPSIDVTALGEQLVAVGADAGVAAAITSYLRSWQELWGVKGVPVGPEASGLLGNLFLVPVDQALRDAGVRFGRYTDDYRLWLDDPDSWPMARDTVIGAVTALGLEVNPKKTRHLRTAHGVVRILSNPDIGELKDMLTADPAGGMAAVLDALDAEVAQPKPDPTRLRWLLKVLLNRRSDHALTALQARPELMQADPRLWANYLKVMHVARKLDVDWLLEQATAEPAPATAAVAYHLMRVVSDLRVGREQGRQLRTFATDPDKRWMPVRCAAAEAWGWSADWNVGAATEAALNLGDAQQRRALALTLRRTESGRKVDAALTKLHTTVPECRPAVAWIRSGAHLAAA